MKAFNINNWLSAICGLMIIISGCTKISSRSKPSSEAFKGKIDKDLSLSGTVIVDGDVLIPKGITLTLAPGTQLIFNKTDSTTIEPEFLYNTHELLVRGTLIARGTAEKPIRFSGKESAAKSWAGIILDHSEDSTLNNCIISQAENGILSIASNAQIKQLDVYQVQKGLVIQKKPFPKINGLSIKKAEVGVSCPEEYIPQISAKTQEVSYPLSPF